MHRIDLALRWWVNRLRCMTPLEMLHRAWRAARTAFVYSDRRSTAPPPSLSGAGVEPWLPEAPALERAPYVKAATRIAAGRVAILSLPDAECGMPPRWNRHPLSGFEWPLRNGLRLPIKGHAHGDIKYLWEPNRHLHLVRLAQAFRLTGDVTHAEALMRLLDSWFEQCPYRLGPNWASAMEAALRLINWSLCWQLLGGVNGALFTGADGARLRGRWLASVYQHMDFVRRNLSLYSSANNHLIGELAGLFIAGRTWPLWNEAVGWTESAQRHLTAECLKQNGADGVNLEQATSYQVFVLEYLLLAGLCARAGAVDFPAAYWQRLEAMSDYLYFLGNLGESVPAIGDSDDAAVVRLSPDPDFDQRRALLASAALLFQRDDFAAAAGRLDDQTAWLLGRGSEARFAELLARRQERPLKVDFPNGGYRALGMAQPGRLRALFDTGPLGYTRIAAHGHADALALLLWLDGAPVLVDAGTYCYNDQPKWRAYFRGTAAHNTLRVDGLDQSEPGGAFMWLRKAAVTRLPCPSPGGTEAVGAVHDGYRRLADPVLHERRVDLTQAPQQLIVTDTVSCLGMHEIEIAWQFSERLQVCADGRALTVAGAADPLRVTVLEGEGAWRLYRGQEEPPRGWRSPRFGVKVPITTAVWHASIDSTHRFRTSFELLAP